MTASATATIDQRLAEGWRSFQAGKIAEAEASARALMAEAPNNADVLHLMARVCHRQGRAGEASALFVRAIATRPDDTGVRNSYGCMLMEQGRVQEAASALEQALAIRSGDALTLKNLGAVTAAQGNLRGAARYFQQALEFKPDYAEAHVSLAGVLRDLCRADDALSHARRAAQLQPNNAFAHATHGILLHELGRPTEAVAALRRALAVDPNNGEAQSNLRIVYSAMVPKWHFTMLNDELRNSTYDRGIRTAVRPGDHVLEIGAGSGLLAMMAARAGAAQVTTCEVNPALADVAREIVAANGMADRVKVIPRKSTLLEVGRDLPRPADLLIMEIFDTVLVGEGVLPSLEDARKRLLAPDARVLPQRARVYAAGIEVPVLRRVNPVGSVAGFDLSRFDIFRNPAGAMVELSSEEHRLLTEPFPVFDFDFRAAVPGSGVRKIAVAASAAGTMQAVAVWYDLFLDDATMMSTAPGAKGNHWGQAVSFQPADFAVTAGQKLVAQAAYSGTRLQVRIEAA